jgi:hypothetical protein
MPIADTVEGESPPKPRLAQAGLDLMVLSYIQGVIKVDERIVLNLPIGGKGYDDQEKAGQEFGTITVHTRNLVHWDGP